MIQHLLCSEALPTKTRGGFLVRMLSFSDSSPWPQPKVGACGKPAGQGIGVNYYSLTPEPVEWDACISGILDFCNVRVKSQTRSQHSVTTSYLGASNE
jgi:hypothetical protein